MAQLKTYYDTLQVSRSANEAVIRAAYRTLTQKYHPDKNLNNIEGALRDTKRLNEAYEVLSDPVRRDAYDKAVEQQEGEMHYQQPTRQRSASESSGAGRQPPDSFGSDAKSQDTAATQREKAQGRSRFDHYAAEAAQANKYRSTHAQKPTDNTEKGGTFGFTFGNLILICLVGGWSLGRFTYKNMSKGVGEYGFFELLFNAGFLGMALVPTIILLICAVVGWVIGWMISSIRRHASWAGFALAVCGFAALWFGEEETRRLQDAPIAGEPAKITQIATYGADVSDSSRLYLEALKQIETQYPVLNPDNPGQRGDLIEQVAKKTNEYVKQGIAKHNALKLAVADMERQQSQPSTSTDGAFAAYVGSRSTPPPGYNQVQPVLRDLTIDEKVTIDMACNSFQMRGDITGFQSCTRAQTARALSGPTIPSMRHLTIEERVTIGMACNTFQMNGDIAGFQSCMGVQIAKTVR